MKVAKRQSLNEEQLLQGKKDLGEFNFPVYAIRRKLNPAPLIPEKQIYVEAERFTDARSFGIRLLGVSEVMIEPLVATRPYPRWQVKWAGHAAGTPTLRMQARRMVSAFSNPKFTDVRDL